MTINNKQLDQEIWTTIKDFPDYKISTYGRIKRRIDSKGKNYKKDYIISQCYDKDGYPRASLRKVNTKITVHIHRLMGKTFLKTPKNSKKTQINHKDGNKSNNHILNLEWVTLTENRRHAVNILKRYNHGKHTKDTILKIHYMRMDGISPSIISHELNVGFSHVEQILTRKTRKQDLEGLPTNYPKLDKGPNTKHPFIPRNKIRSY